MRGEISKDKATAPALAVENLHVFYKNAHVVQGANLTLQQGALSVVGRNGMGKTTLCKAIMGLLPVRDGLIRLRGSKINGHPPHIIARSGVGYVPQGRQLWHTLNVDEHLALVSREGGGSIEEVYKMFPRLADRRNHRGVQLSGGEQQMLAIGRALLGNPRLLIMDEPTEGLAPVIVRQIEDIIAALIANGKTSVLIVEQNLGVAVRASATTAIMVNGRINRIIPSAELAADRALQRSLLGIGRENGGIQ